MSVIDNLNVSAEALSAAISGYENQKAQMENSYLKISNEVRQLDSAWNGEASEKFKTSFDALYKNISQTETVMSNIIEKLKKALEIYQQTSDAAKNLASNLDPGEAFKSFLS